ncbi:RING finger protein [Rhynchospora pubera]|uniref:RING finger protein n=1 Tax=Rhynchospora pubera TaxID=906938 RepID=A0AAV8ALJ1_9POAL|nr:RING finger protein [Rhynchospora pubera]KAJ4815230.1 RING finger protein [Rhynchospora pubera]
MGHGAGTNPLEVVHTVIEMAEVARYAVEHCPHRHKASDGAHDKPDVSDKVDAKKVGEIERIRLENLKLRRQLATNFVLIQELCKSPDFSNECPPDLYTQLQAAANSSNFLGRVESAHQESIIALNKMTEAVEVPIVVGEKEPSWWVWLPDISNLEEPSGIDNSSYVVVTQEEVIDGIANFVARCILEDPKSKELKPEEIQKAVTKALDNIKVRLKWKSVWEAGKIIYTLASWGIALYGLYSNRALVKAAAQGVGKTANVVLKAL